MVTLQHGLFDVSVKEQSFSLAITSYHADDVVSIIEGPYLRMMYTRLRKNIFALLLVKAWSHRRTDMYRKENGLKYAEFSYPVTKFISSAAQSSRDRFVEPGS